MANIDKNKFIKTYGINDDKFLAYLNKFDTFSKIVDMGRLDVISKEKLNHLYNKFVYYNSLGHSLDTIVNETINYIKHLFFFDEHGNFEYLLPVIDSIENSNNSCFVAISNKMCHIRISFRNTSEIPQRTIISKLSPAPIVNCSTIAYCDKANNIVLSVIPEGVRLEKGTIPANSQVVCTFTYPIKK